MSDSDRLKAERLVELRKKAHSAASEKKRAMNLGKLIPNPYTEPHLACLTQKQAGFVMDTVLTGDYTEAARRNFDTTERNASHMGYNYIKKPEIRAAIEAEYAILNKRITEDYIASKLLVFEDIAKKDRDLTAMKGAYELMIKLKGLGSTRIIKESADNRRFDYKSPEELKEGMVNTVKALVDKGMLNYEEFLADLDKEVKHVEYVGRQIDSPASVVLIEHGLKPEKA